MATQAHPAVAAAPQTPNIQTQKPFVAFQPGNVPPSQSVYLQLNDSIFIRFIANGAYPLSFNYRYLTPQGEIKEGALPLNTTGGSIQTAQIPLEEVWLLSFCFTTPNNLAAGAWIHAQVGIVRGQATSFIPPMQGLIWQGYIYGTGANGWPGTPSKEVWDSPGMPRVITGTQPAAGAEIIDTVPNLRRWQLLSAYFQLSTSATVANRFPAFYFDDGATFPYRCGVLTAIVASTVGRIDFTNALTTFTDAFPETVIPAPPNIFLKANWRIRTTTTGLQAGDQWLGTAYYVLEWGSYDV